MWKLREKVLISKKSEFIKSKQIKNERSLHNTISTYKIDYLNNFRNNEERGNMHS
jgi:hypothetical protein